jgi:hypothetical protein
MSSSAWSTCNTPLWSPVKHSARKGFHAQEVNNAAGTAQQDKADAQKDVAKKEAQADLARAGAKAAEKRQEAEQRQ